MSSIKDIQKSCPSSSDSDIDSEKDLEILKHGKLSRVLRSTFLQHIVAD